MIRKSDASLFKFHVLVAGAGPVGLTAANELARYGLKVRIIDKAPLPATTSRALGTWPRTLEHFKRMGLADEIVSQGCKLTSRELYLGPERVATLSFGEIRSEFPFGLLLPQTIIERTLERNLSEKFGVLVERSIEMVDLNQDELGVSVKVRHVKGDFEEVIHCQWLIGCDGAHSQVRRAIGVEFPGLTFDTHAGLADLKFEGDPSEALPTGMRWHRHRDGLLGVLAQVDKTYRVVYVPATKLLESEELEELLRNCGGYDLKIEEVKWKSRFRTNERQATHFSVGRVFLAGDAAHIHSPAGGQGMNTGIQDSVNLAWKLAFITKAEINGKTMRSFVESYAIEREPVAAQIIKKSGRMARNALFGNSVFQWVRLKLLGLISQYPAVMEWMDPDVTMLYIKYPVSPIHGLGRIEGYGPGDRFQTEAYVCTGTEPLYTIFTWPVYFPQAKQLASAYPAYIHSKVEEIMPKDGICPNAFIIVRPDGYVAHSVSAENWMLCYQYFGMMAGEDED